MLFMFRRHRRNRHHKNGCRIEWTIAKEWKWCTLSLDKHEATQCHAKSHQRRPLFLDPMEVSNERDGEGSFV